ncbi:hypothetical protein L596_013206 [Steinernema carpocapsae]|uniref:BTB domain-containing protein n=1 Tax=Steinernema carpocapsae TaxID=34508 RepID=A0A4U5NZH0_STECR|nr:hypothetical protein L596_013206 [Steinernema carpocapsae]
MWHHSFDNVAASLWFSHQKNNDDFSKALQLVDQPKVEVAHGEIHVEIVDSFIADISDPENPLIQGPGDAVKFSSGGIELWFSKKVLCASSATFAGRFKVDALELFLNTLPIDEFLDEFLHFFGLYHGLSMSNIADYVQGLLTHAQVFGCKLIHRRCEDFLRGTSDEKVPLAEKIRLCNRFNLHTLLVETTAKTSTSAGRSGVISKGVISFKFVDGISDPREINDFKWILEKGMCDGTTDSELCDKIICEPKKENPAILWTCLAVGTLSVVNKKDGKHNAYLEWNASFGNNANWCHLHHDKEKLRTALGAVGEPFSKDVSGEVYVGIVNSLCVDLKDRTNSLIHGREDAAKVKIDGKELFLSKTVLGAHSLFFYELFKTKKGKYNLKDLQDVKLEEFLQFLGVVHSLNMPIDKCSVERLLTLAELFQCKVVRRHCEDFLRSAPISVITNTKKLLLCDHFKLYGLLLDLFEEMCVEELKKLCLPPGQSFSPLLSSLLSLKFGLVN